MLVDELLCYVWFWVFLKVVIENYLGLICIDDVVLDFVCFLEVFVGSVVFEIGDESDCGVENSEWLLGYMWNCNVSEFEFEGCCG